MIHCADIHLDSKLTTNLPIEKARQRRRELLHTFQKMVEFADKKKVEAILIAGDLFDNEVVSTSALLFVKDMIRKYPKITFFYLSGNHDKQITRQLMEDLPDNLKLFEENWTSHRLGEDGSIHVTGLILTEENYLSCYTSLRLESSDFNIVVLHGQAGRGVMQHNAEAINLTALQYQNIDYLALGHLHSYQKERLDERGMYCYSGCLEARGFDETGEHGFVLLEIDEQTHQFRSQFIAIAQRRFFELTVDVTGTMTTMQMVDRIWEEVKEREVTAKDMLKINLVGELSMDSEKDISMIEMQFESSFFFYKIVDNIKWRVELSDYAQQKSLKGEFVRLLFAQEEMDPEERAKIIQLGIAALRGDELG